MTFTKYNRITRWTPQKEFLHCWQCNFCLDGEDNVWDNCPNCTEKDKSTPIRESLEFDFENSQDLEVRAEAAYRLGCFYSDLSGEDAFENNCYQAVSWFLNAAFLGHLEAMYRLANFYSESESELDVSTALVYIDKINEREKDDVTRSGKTALKNLEKYCHEKLNEIRAKAGK